MNTAGALVIDPVSGDPERRPGFTLNVQAVQNVTVRGNYSKGFRVMLGDVVQCGPYSDPAVAWMMAQRYEGVWERAS